MIQLLHALFTALRNMVAMSFPQKASSPEIGRPSFGPARHPHGRLNWIHALMPLAPLLMVPAPAAAKTLALSFTAADFFNGFGSPTTPPLAFVQGAFTATFDESADIDEQRSNIGVHGLNFAFDRPLVLSYDRANDMLFLGGGCPCGVSGGLFELESLTNDFLLGVEHAASAAPTFLTFGYTQAGFDDVAIAQTGSVAAVPEAATWAMLIVGYGVMGSALRRRNAYARLAATELQV